MPCLLHSHRFHFSQKTGAAKDETAGINAAQTPGFLSGSDLTHFDASAKPPGQITHQVSKINSLLGRIDENKLAALYSAIDFNQFELQIQICSLPPADRRRRPETGAPTG